MWRGKTELGPGSDGPKPPARAEGQEKYLCGVRGVSCNPSCMSPGPGVIGGCS